MDEKKLQEDWLKNQYLSKSDENVNQLIFWRNSREAINGLIKIFHFYWFSQQFIDIFADKIRISKCFKRKSNVLIFIFLRVATKNLKNKN